MHNPTTPFARIIRWLRSACVLQACLFTAAWLAAVASHAAAPQVRTQAPGFYRVMVGKYEVTALLDGTHTFPIDSAMTNVSQGEIERDLEEENLKRPVQGSINAFLINTGSQLVLIDTGAGALYGDCCGQLMRNLRAAGYRPEQVDLVLITHLHKDHVGGVLVDGKMAFPNTVVRVSRSDKDYWTTPGNRDTAPAILSSFFDAASAMLAPYAAAGRVAPFDFNDELAPGIRPIATPGHTPGHASYLVTSGGENLLVWGDAIHVAAIQLRDPKASVA